MQDEAPPSEEYEPAGQLAQLSEANDDANWPAVQLVQAVAPEAEIEPGAHATHAVEPATAGEQGQKKSQSVALHSPFSDNYSVRHIGRVNRKRANTYRG